jgi:hypothetical protein
VSGRHSRERDRLCWIPSSAAMCFLVVDCMTSDLRTLCTLCPRFVQTPNPASVTLGLNQALTGSIDPRAEVGAQIAALANGGPALRPAQLEPGSSSEAAKCRALACSAISRRAPRAEGCYLHSHEHAEGFSGETEHTATARSGNSKAHRAPRNGRRWTGTS